MPDKFPRIKPYTHEVECTKDWRGGLITYVTGITWTANDRHTLPGSVNLLGYPEDRFGRKLLGRVNGPYEPPGKEETMGYLRKLYKVRPADIECIRVFADETDWT